MGIEAFTITINAERTSSMEKVHKSVEVLKHIKFLNTYKDETTYEFYDGKHLFEILIRENENYNYFQINVRFALSNYDTIEPLFLNFVEWCLNQWKASIILQTSLLKKKIEYEVNEALLFLQLAPDEIKALRDYWLSNFQSKRGPVRVEDAYLLVEE